MTRQDKASMQSEHDNIADPNIVRAVLTDIQFWIPAVVLLGGIALLVFLH